MFTSPYLKDMAKRTLPWSRNPRLIIDVLTIVILGVILYFQWPRGTEPTPALTGAQPIRQPEPLALAQSPLRESIIAAGDYLLRQQLPNGDLTYQVDVVTGNRKFLPVTVRQLATVGSLYTVCRVTQDAKYCTAADRALQYYWKDVVPVPTPYEGKCYFSYGGCLTGASGIAIDAVYKRWLATGNVMLGDENLLDTARDIGRFITSLQTSTGEYGELLYPVGSVTVDSHYSSWYNPAESLYGLSELYEMTGEAVWLEHTRALTALAIQKPVSPDQWYAHTLNMLVRSGVATSADLTYGQAIGDWIVQKQAELLVPSGQSFDIATKLEAMSSLAQAFRRSGLDTEKLDAAMPAFIEYLQARQLPHEDCSWSLTTADVENYAGGMFINCDESLVRADLLMHWIFALTTYLEYTALAPA